MTSYKAEVLSEGKSVWKVERQPIPTPDTLGPYLFRNLPPGSATVTRPRWATHEKAYVHRGLGGDPSMHRENRGPPIYVDAWQSLMRRGGKWLTGPGWDGQRLQRRDRPTMC